MLPALEFSIYHKVLRVSVCIFATILLFDSGILSATTTRLSEHTQQYLANAVGVYVGVAPNDVNTLTAQIAKLEQERDLALGEREMSIGLNEGGVRGDNTSTFILSGILFILLVLIILNYALDYARSREHYVDNEQRSSPVA